MKALVRHRYGGPEVMTVEDVARPNPTASEVLILVCSVSINPLDWHILRGSPWFARFTTGLRSPKTSILGADISGVIEQVGSDVRRFRVGDEVFGSLFEGQLGGLAEYVSVDPDMITSKPANVSHAEAAAAPTAAITALQAVRAVEVSEGKSVLVNGASGGVGTYAVQIAKVFGGNVTGVCSARNINLVKDLGATTVVDYSEDDFVIMPTKYHALIYAVGNRSPRDLKRSLTHSGVCKVVGFSSTGLLLQSAFIGPLISSKSGWKVGLLGTVKVNLPDLETISNMLESADVKSVVYRECSLEAGRDSLAELEAGHVPGKIVINL